jgi:pimeloyl-ACP methyl ester carboxylesterase
MAHNVGMDEFDFLPPKPPSSPSHLPGAPSLLRHRRGRTISALQYGDAETGGFPDPVVTLLHGAGLNAHTWDTTVLALDLPALALDLPGHGDSSWRDDAAYTGAPSPPTSPALAAWTRAPQVLVGQSLGGLTAAALASAHPELVRELVVVDITPGIDPNGDAAQIGAFFAGPTDWASRDELVDRALAFGLGGTREAATRGVFLNRACARTDAWSGSTTSPTSRTPSAPIRPRPRAPRPSSPRSGRARGIRLGRSRRGHRPDHARARRTRIRDAGGCR